MKRKHMVLVLAVVSLFMMMSAAASADTITGPPVYNNSGPRWDYDVEYKITEVVMVPVYCFYSPVMKDYFWTASEKEMNQLVKDYSLGTSTYQYQGITGHVEQTPNEENVPVYRFWNKSTLDHFYTTSETEKEQLAEDLASGKDHYKYEGIAWYVPETSDVTVYRFFDERNFNHYYTADQDVKDSLYQAYMNGTSWYRYEGIAWHWYP